MRCPVCDGATEPLGTQQVLGVHTAEYVVCTGCGSVAVVGPTWLGEAYGEAIADSDVGLVQRSVATAECVAALARTAGIPGPHLDYGGGEGLLVRLLRNRGLDARWYDPMATNRYARGCEAEPAGRFGIVTAVEVVEHLTDPVATIRELLDLTDVLVLSTFLVPEPAPAPGTWWYYTPDTGQHITFLSRRGLQSTADSLGVHLISHGNLHVLSRRRLPLRTRALASRPRRSALWNSLRRWPSLTQSDYEAALRSRAQPDGSAGERLQPPTGQPDGPDHLS